MADAEPIGIVHTAERQNGRIQILRNFGKTFLIASQVHGEIVHDEHLQDAVGPVLIQGCV